MEGQTLDPEENAKGTTSALSHLPHREGNENSFFHLRLLYLLSALASFLRFASPALRLHVFPSLPFDLSPALPFGLKALLSKRDFLVAVVFLAKKTFV